jgi:Arc/MetJ-type ribon-helix-helix transcriptional regulator
MKSKSDDEKAVRSSISLPQDLAKWLRTRAETHRQNFSEVVKIALEQLRQSEFENNQHLYQIVAESQGKSKPQNKDAAGSGDVGASSVTDLRTSVTSKKYPKPSREKSSHS